MGSNPTFGTIASGWRTHRSCVVSDSPPVATSLALPRAIGHRWNQALGTWRTVPPAVTKPSRGPFWSAPRRAPLPRKTSLRRYDGRYMASPRTRRFIGYPAGSLLAVLPDAESAARAAAAARAAGTPDRDITILRGAEGADRLDGTGAVHGVIARLRRLVSFTLMDQLVDMALYEQAVREGQVVLMVRPGDNERKATAIALLRQHGGHFINHYGRFATEEIERWHGPEPNVPGLLRR